MKIKNKKKMILIIVAVIILVVVMIFAFKMLNKNEVNMSVDANGNAIDGSLRADGSEIKLKDDGTTSDYTYNPNSIPQKDTDYNEQYLDNKGNELSGEDLSKIKDNIIQEFKEVPIDKLGLDVDLNNIRIIFNQGTTLIDKNNCLVFCIYVAENNTLRNVGMYAMSEDTKVLYKFNSDALTYDLIEK